MYHATKKKVHSLLHPEIVGDSRWDRIINIFIVILIMLNVIAVMLETVQSLRTKYHEFFSYFEVVSVIIFTIEYLLRVWSSNHEEKYKHSIWGRLKYMVSPAALVDLLAILPFYVHVIVGLDLRILRILRLMRFFRFFRLTAYTKATQLVLRVFKSRLNELMLAFVMTLFLVVIAACLVYFAEYNTPDSKFTSIPETIWWAIETLTTVGYGDMVPVTIIGKVFASVIIMAGVALLALPAGIITAGFLDEARKIREQEQGPKKCPHCGKPLEEDKHHGH